MRRLHLLHILLLAPGLLAVSALVWLAVKALKFANEAGNHDVLLMGWVLMFVVGLPLLLAILPLAGALQSHAARHHIVPNAGLKIP
ncbi:MAG: hypothetical protein JWL98_1133 [Xanthomonadaceae bacterium]|nr:hypothetical protein [Xanthomonadaceae bacterium]